MNNTTDTAQAEKENEIKEMEKAFKNLMCPYGSSDLYRALEIAQEIGETEDFLFEEIENFCDDTGTKKENIDVVYIMYDTILQNSRNIIDEKTGKDIQNDFNFEVYGNYICTSYDCDEETREKVLKLAVKTQKILKKEGEENKMLDWFIEELKNM